MQNLNSKNLSASFELFYLILFSTGLKQNNKCYNKLKSDGIWFESCHLLGSRYIFQNSTTVNFRYLEVVGTIFYKFKLPEVQINLNFE